jgi:two-component sensor histidine kinase
MNTSGEVMRRIGGGYSVSWFAFLVTLCLNFLHHLSGSPGVQGNWPIRIVAVLAAQLAMFGVLIAARATVLRRAEERPRPSATLVVFMAAGCTRSLVLWGILTQVLDVAGFVVFGGIVTGTFTFAGYLALCSYLVSVFSENRRRVLEAARAQAALRAARAKAEQVLRDQRRETMEVVQADLLAAFDGMAARSDAVDHQQMRGFLDQTVRPASHQLAARIDRWQPPQTEIVDPRLRWRRLYEAVGLSQPFSPVPQACLCAAPAFATLLAVGPARFLLVLAAAVIAPLGVLTWGNRVIGRLPSTISTHERVAAVLGWVVLSATLVALTWAASLAGTVLAMPGFIYGILITMTLSLAGVAATTALTAQRQLQHELQGAQAELRWDVARVHQLQWHQQRVSARALHGPVQSAIIRDTVRLGRDSSNASADYLRNSLTAALQAAFHDTDASPSLEASLASLARSWESLCDITYEMTCDPAAVDADPCAKSCLVDILSETVANAVRHGYASHVAIRMDRCTSSVLSVDVSDDGRGGSASTCGGLGTQIMDDCCLEWERSSGEGGTTVRFLMPFDGLATPAQTDRLAPDVAPNVESVPRPRSLDPLPRP